MLQTGTSWMRTSPLEVLITRCCEPSLHEPNYALHLEVADYVNKKKANNPREAAMMIARLANHRNPHIALLSLSLLDTLVQSCGYAFHLQISTKEFLNELVRRFPERPPPFPNPVMTRILDLIHGWKEGICTDSRWREDLGNVRDMHRLLTFKGYRFREIGRQPPALNAMNIKSAEELEEEDREAQSAKLQELIRRGTPRDLAAAQELMKSLAGANPDAKPDYRAQALNELNKLEQKVILLNEMLDNVDQQQGVEQFVSGDAYDQVASILKSARPKIQKWINDAESDDSESLDTFLQINDQINTVLGRYDAFKKGDFAAAANPIPSELSTNTQGASLIDFDDGTTTNNADPTNPSGGIDDLAGLFAAPAQPTISNQQAFGNSVSTRSVPPTHSPIPTTLLSSNDNNGFGGLRLGGGSGSGSGSGTSSPFQARQSATPPAAIMLPTSPAPGQSAFSASPPMPSMFGGMGGTMIAAQRPSSQPQPQPQQQVQTQAQTQKKDPFADLAGLF